MTQSPGRPPLHREDIKAAIRKRGLTLFDVGRLCDPAVSPQMVTNVLGQHSTSASVEVGLALASGFSVGEVQQVTRGDRSPAQRPDTRPDAPTAAMGRISRAAA